MATVHKVSGYDAFVSFIGDLVEKNPKSQINVYFTGNKLESGKSWCPDCNDAEPFIQKYGIDGGSPETHFVIVEVGDRPTYKDPKCPFRSDKDTHLSNIPTLINWNEKAKRLEGDQLCKPELLEMFFEQE